jgi:predicted dehydrogenase
VDTYGVLIVGAGHIGRAHVEAWKANSRMRVVGVVDVLPDRAEEVARELDVTESGQDYRPFLDRPDVQVVAVCTPPFAHCQPTLDALAAGKHVACEKPFTLVVEEAQRMVAAAERARRHLAMCSARARYNAAALKARELVENGTLGTVYHSRSSQFRQRGRPGVDILKDATWFISKQRAGGGALIDIGVYEIDLMLWLMGNPRVLSVSATTYQGIGEPRTDVTQDVEDHATVFCQLEGNRSFSLEIAWSSHVCRENTRFLLGDRAGLRFNPLTLLTPPAQGERACREEQLLEKDDAGGGLPGIVAGFVQALDGGPAPMTPARDALVVTQVIDAAYRSAASGKPVTL